ncbi:MAG TPA: hypothetical protein VF432_10165 [Thermoanaerobaculia bacterium]
MAHHNIEFLHKSILGERAGSLDARTFSSVSTDAIGLPEYRSQYFESFPSSWAAAYAFTKLLHRGERVAAAEVSAAVREWVTLFALHYLRVAYVTSHDPESLRDADPDFWPAISGTFPSVGNGAIERLQVLRVDERTVIGGFYPVVVFFPARDRSGWSTHSRLRPYVEGGSLSWPRTQAQLQKVGLERKFEAHLRSIAQSCLAHSVQQTLITFCDVTFTGPTAREQTQHLDADPAAWPIPVAAGEDAGDLLATYPLKQSNREGGTTYYLVSGLDASTARWIDEPIGAHLPAPADYDRVSERQVSIAVAGSTRTASIGEKDRIVLLRDLFLKQEPYWTRNPRSKDFAARVRRLHTLDVSGAPGIFAGVQNDSQAVCLVPATAAMLAEFPSLLNDEGAITVHYNRAADVLEWQFRILGRELAWRTSAVWAKALASCSVAIWPPSPAPDWHIYVAKGTGTKESYGRWALVDEKGRVADRLVDVEDDEYVSILSNEKDRCRPRALLLRDAQDLERGILILAPFEHTAVDYEKEVALAVDFGTSNTCLAARVGNGEPATLTFGTAPVTVWGTPPQAETPGFVPFDWGAKRGYYPSVLLSQIAAPELRNIPVANLRPEHLFQVDIPGLHFKLEDTILKGSTRQRWSLHKDLKWQSDQRTPWRGLFLSLSLLYAHAELFAKEHAIPRKYVFTFPLAFSEHQRQGFHEEARRILKMVRAFCFGDAAGNFDYVDHVDESRAIAKSAQAVPNPGVVELFVDVGGGTADIAIRHESDFLVLDSIKLAGKAFFRFTEQNFREQLIASDELRRHLTNLSLRTLVDTDANERLSQLNLDLATAYSLTISGLDETTFRQKEGAILEEGFGHRSFQRYRSQLFFRHLLAYGLLQACAAAVDHKLPVSQGGINLICSGNGWGLLLFAQLHRSKKELKAEAEKILEALKNEVIPHLTQDEAAIVNALTIMSVNLMNERDLRQAKTSVALGALKAAATAAREDRGSTAPYVGVTLSNVSINGTSITELRWCQRWAEKDLAARVKADHIETFNFDALEAGKPMSTTLSLFTKIANLSNRTVDQLSPENWMAVNGSIRENYIGSLKLAQTPINYFVSDVLYPEDSEHRLLNDLARLNQSYNG